MQFFLCAAQWYHKILYVKSSSGEIYFFFQENCRVLDLHRTIFIKRLWKRENLVNKNPKSNYKSSSLMFVQITNDFIGYGRQYLSRVSVHIDEVCPL